MIAGQIFPFVLLRKLLHDRVGSDQRATQAASGTTKSFWMGIHGRRRGQGKIFGR